MNHYLLCLSALLFFNCEGTSKNDTYSVNQVKLITTNKALLTNFAQAHERSDSLVKAFLNKDDLTDFAIKYGFHYQGQVKGLKDTLTELPISYNFYYGLKYEGDTISSANIEVDTTFKFIHRGLNKLSGMKKFLTNEYKFGPRQAALIAQREGVDTVNADIIFTGSGWKVASHCDGCKILVISAETGKISSEGTIRFIP